jgi:lysyl-tRNA synthetase class 2
MYTDPASGPRRAFLRKRADFLEEIRRFFRFRDVIEVDTPVLSSVTATDPQLDSFECDTGAGLRYLLTSPEHAMKRLLAEGSGPIFQMGKVFRRGESGSRHNPEFTMLEWYRPGFTLEALQTEVCDLMQSLGLIDQVKTLQESVLTLSYREAFRQACGFDPFYTASTELCRLACLAGNMSPDAFMVNAVIDRDATLDLLVSHRLEPWLQQHGTVFLTDFPASQAALAVVRNDEYGVPVAKRFELYINGMEIANAYEELTNPQEQRIRFEADNARRRELGKAEIPIDERLLACLPHMPACAGIALGVDRLFMQKYAIQAIDAAMPFAWKQS